MFRLTDPTGRYRIDWFFSYGTYTIGRSSECALTIDDSTVSRKHAQINAISEQKIIITDLGSHNGTTVNGSKITNSVSITFGNIILLGQVELKLTRSVSTCTDGRSDSVTEIDYDLTNAIRIHINDALKPLSTRTTNDPEVFKAFSEMGKMLILPDPEGKMFTKALELLKGIIPAERIAIFLTGKEENEIILADYYTADSRNSNSFTFSQTIVNELLTQKNAILIPDIQSDKKFTEQKSIIELKIKSAMATPLFDNGEILGILYVDTTDPRKQFNEEYLRIIAAFGNILAAKLINCNLLREIQNKKILEAELEAAAQIQRQLLPKMLPNIDGYEPYAFQIQCKQVGGDLYDVANLEDGRIIFLLADVSGKGMGAALLASNILASFRVLYCANNFDLLDTVRTVSEQLLAFTRPEDFVTLFIGILSPSTNTFRYVNAGHDPPMVVRNDSKVEYLEASGIPMGAMDSAKWKEETLKFMVGDLLFVFTDGIPEANNEEDEQFGDDKLVKSVQKCRNQSPEELTKSIMNEVNMFIGNNPRSDDITMLVLNREL